VITVPDGTIVLEPREVFDAALVGVRSKPREGVTLAVYSREKCIQALMRAEGWDYEEAEEYFDFNTAGSYIGPGTPVFHR
jgi:hypothetical protein